MKKDDITWNLIKMINSESVKSDCNKTKKYYPNSNWKQRRKGFIDRIEYRERNRGIYIKDS
jgi:hypothetical protein